MQYQTCPHCGAHLDFGERCNCRDKKEPPPDGNRESGKINYPRILYRHMEEKSSEN